MPPVIREGYVPHVKGHEAHDRLMGRINNLGYADPNREVIKNIAFACRDESTAIDSERLVELIRGVLQRSRYVEASPATEEKSARIGSMPVEDLMQFVHHAVLGADRLRPVDGLAYANAPAHARVAEAAPTGGVAL